MPPSNPVRRSSARLLIGAALMVSACSGGVGGSGALEAVGRPDARSDRQTTADGGIGVALGKSLLDAGSDLFRAVRAKVWEGRVLLAGVVESEAERRRVEALARKVPGVNQVHNELKVGPTPSASSLEADEATEQRIGTTLMLDGGIRAADYSYTVIDGVAYVIGRARSETERERVLASLKAVEGVRSVVPHVRADERGTS